MRRKVTGGRTGGAASSASRRTGRQLPRPRPGATVRRTKLRTPSRRRCAGAGRCGGRRRRGSGRRSKRQSVARRVEGPKPACGPVPRHGLRGKDDEVLLVAGATSAGSERQDLRITLAGVEREEQIPHVRPSSSREGNAARSRTTSLAPGSTGARTVSPLPWRTATSCAGAGGTAASTRRRCVCSGQTCTTSAWEGATLLAVTVLQRRGSRKEGEPCLMWSGRQPAERQPRPTAEAPS